MSKQITIRDYDLDAGRVDTPETSPFLGLNIGEQHYIISEEDFCLNSTEGRGGLVKPKTAYELVSYNERTCLAKAREVVDPSLLETIAVEFHMLGRE